MNREKKPSGGRRASKAGAAVAAKPASPGGPRRAHEPPSDALLEAAAAQFRALSEPARLKVLRRLMEGEASVGELGVALGSSQANASKHVAVLAAVGFVRRRKEGSTVLCSLGDEVVRDLCALMCERAVARATEGLRVVGG